MTKLFLNNMTCMKIAFWIVAFLLLFLDGHTQYKRKGETLQTRGNSSVGTKKKADFSLEQLRGRWQEIQRLDRVNGQPVPFNDSIQLYFSDSNKVKTRTSVATGMTMEGEAEIDPDNTLTAAADVYLIKSLNDSLLILDDNDKFIHRLRKMRRFWYESLGKTSIQSVNYVVAVRVDLSNLIGDWRIYRRKAKPGTMENTTLIRNLNILKRENASTARGNIVFYRDQAIQQLPCVVTLVDTTLTIIADAHKWTLSTYQADKNNFVFGNKDLVYFSKR